MEPMKHGLVARYEPLGREGDGFEVIRGSSIGRWPYGYYMLLRVVVFAAALLQGGLIYQQAKAFHAMGWAVLGRCHRFQSDHAASPDACGVVNPNVQEPQGGSQP
jgi:hypothetical protein